MGRSQLTSNCPCNWVFECLHAKQIQFSVCSLKCLRHKMSALQTTRCVLLLYLHLFSLAAMCPPSFCLDSLSCECIIKTMWLQLGLGIFKNSNTGIIDLYRSRTRYQMQRWRPFKPMTVACLLRMPKKFSGIHVHFLGTSPIEYAK